MRKAAFHAKALQMSCLLAALTSNASGSEHSVRFAQAGPTISMLSPSAGTFGTQITIHGTNFTADNQVEFHGAEVTFRPGSPVKSEDSTSLLVRVSPCPSREPQCPTYYVPPGRYAVSVINAKGVSNEVPFSLTGR
jgi:hypothetical protein